MPRLPAGIVSTQTSKPLSFFSFRRTSKHTSFLAIRVFPSLRLLRSQTKLQFFHCRAFAFSSLDLQQLTASEQPSDFFGIHSSTIELAPTSALTGQYAKGVPSSTMPPTEDLAVVEDERTESFSRRTTFYVNHEWEAGAKSGQGTYIRGQMYVESLEPLKRTQKWPIILIHGDYHSSQVVILRSIHMIPAG